MKTLAALLALAASVGGAPRPGGIALVGDMRPTLVPRVYTFDAAGGARADLAAAAGGGWDPAVSPDGASVAFAGAEGGRPAVFVVPASGGAARAITAPIPCAGRIAHPTWAPGSDRIVFDVYFGLVCTRRLASRAYTTAERHQLAVVSADGADQRLLGIDGYEPRWSPDGTRLAYVERTTTGLAALPGTTSAVVDLSSGAPRPLGAGTSPSWSPDGRSIALPTRRGTVRVFTADGTLILTLRGSAAGWTACGLAVAPAGEVAVSPDRQTVALHERGGIVTRACGGKQRLLVRGGYQPIAFAPDGSRLLVRPLAVVGGRSVVHLPGQHAGAVAWSPDGARVVYLLPGGRVAIADTHTGRTTLVADEGPQALDSPPLWLTPTTVVYGDRATGLQSNLYMLNPETGATAQVARDAQLPAWAPGGAALAWASPPGIWLAAQPRDEPQVLRRASVTGLAWSPAGRLAFSDGSGISILDGRSATRVLSLGEDAEVALEAWSPDGQWLAYWAYSDGGRSSGIWAVHPDGGGRHLLVDRARKLAWSPDGTRTAYEIDGSLFVADADGANGVRIGALRLASWPSVGPGILAIRSGPSWFTQLVAVSPDGTSVTPLTDANGYVYDAAWAAYPG